MAPLVQVENLEKRFEQVRALNGVSSTWKRANGSPSWGRRAPGKTTLINILGGLDTPTSGRVVVDGMEIAQLD